MRQVMRLAAALAVCASPLAAQAVVGAKAGVVSYAVGKVYVEDRPIEISVTHFPQVAENAVLRTAGGRAEVLLGPCAVLRVDEDSSFRVLDGNLVTPRMELLTGSAVVDIAGIRKESTVFLKVGGATVDMPHAGV